MNHHKVAFNHSFIEKDHRENGDAGLKHSLTYQLTHINKVRGSLRHDNALDALAIVIAYRVGQMVIDEYVAEELYILEQKLAAVEAFLNSDDGLCSTPSHTIGSQYRL